MHSGSVQRRRVAPFPTAASSLGVSYRTAPHHNARYYTPGENGERFFVNGAKQEPHCGRISPPEPVLDVIHDVEDEEDLALNIFNRLDGLSEEEKHKHACTEAFVRIVITTPSEQEWKDMMAAALREGTWREHHFEAILSGVRLLKYDIGQSTPTQRLRRAHAILIFWVEETTVELQSSSERPTNRVVCTLLTQLLRSAMQKHAPPAAHSSNELSPTEAGPSEVSFRRVWRFLAWMELHGYHIHSFELVDKLERCVDEDNDGHAEGEKGAAEGPESEIRSGAAQYASVSTRQNRLEYLRGERARLCKMEKGEDTLGNQRPPSRKVDIPVTEPH
ncbi:unnamed protein product [Phytomonas sp. Hart1]|nr:unnamed protein product [Phytomonas sp. Hart1]|eukprot:CCW69845.1 unnamed protein product [Phytomonas sp. isolate Hart1]